VNELGRFDAVIHNAAVGYQEGQRDTADGFPHVFAVNTLAAGEDTAARVTGRYFYHMKAMAPNPQALDAGLQDKLIALCEGYSGVALP